MKLSEVIASVYEYCGLPAENDAPFSLVYRIARDENQSLCIDLDITDQVWRAGEGIVDVSPNIDTYLVELPDYARVFMAEAPIFSSFAPGSGSIQGIGTSTNGRRRVRVVDLPDQPSISGPINQSPGGALFGGTVQEQLGFYRKDGVLYMRIAPFPYQATTYTIWYEPVEPEMINVGDTPGVLKALPVFYHLLIARIARRAVNYVTAMSPEMKADIRNDLTRAIDDPRSGYLRQWYDYIDEDSQESDGVLGGFTLGDRTGQVY